MSECFIAPLIGAEITGVDWRSYPGCGPTQEADFRFIACRLEFTLSNGSKLTSQRTLTFVDMQAEPSNLARASKITWLKDAPLPSTIVEPPELTPDQSAFQALWEVLLECNRLRKPQNDLFNKAGYDFLRSATVQPVLKNFYDSSYWRDKLARPVHCKLSELGDCLFYKGQIWGIEADTLIELGIQYLQSMTDDETGELQPFTCDPKFQSAYRTLPEVVARVIRTREAKQPKRNTISENVRHEVWRRDEGKCVSCGSKERLEFDHIVPFSRGGSDTARNIQLLCEPCNRKKSARI